MCIIIDTCAFHAVFNPDDSFHHKFKPVYDWIEGKKGKIVIGGTDYKNELIKRTSLKILTEYDKMKRLAKVPDEEVDKLVPALKAQVVHKDFDDPHIVALVIASKCRLICTGERRAIPFFTKKELYPKGVKRPKIYRTARNKDLCCHEHIVGICVVNAPKGAAPLHPRTRARAYLGRS